MFITITADEVVQGRNDDVLALMILIEIDRYLGVFVGLADISSYGSLEVVIHL